MPNAARPVCANVHRGHSRVITASPAAMRESNRLDAEAGVSQAGQRRDMLKGCCKPRAVFVANAVRLAAAPRASRARPEVVRRADLVTKPTKRSGCAAGWAFSANGV